MSGEDRPSDALSALGDAALAEARRETTIPPTPPDPHVGVAFALGWQMAEIYRPDPQPPVAAHDDDHLPGIADLDGDEWARVGLYQVQAGITKLRHAIIAAGLLVPDAELFADGLEGRTGAARDAAVTRFHVELLAVLTAADYRLGKAYGLGQALADISREPTDWRAELAPRRVAVLSAWLRDLSTVLPPHAARVVAGSLTRWGGAAAARPAQETPDVTRDAIELAQLRAQGRLWRSLISGERRATEMLEMSDYVAAGEGLLQSTGRLLGPILRHHIKLVAVVVALFAVGVAVMVIAHDDVGGVVSGAGFVLAALGISYKSIGTVAGRALARVETPLWEASLDTAICARITPQRVLDAAPAPEIGPDEPSIAAATRAARARHPAGPH